MWSLECCKSTLKILLAIVLVLLAVYTLFFQSINQRSCVDPDGTLLEGKPKFGRAKCAWKIGLFWRRTNTSLFLWETSYDGQWFAEKKQGEGVYISASGTKFSGEWEMDSRHGKGEMNLADGTSYSGEWVSNRLTCSSGTLLMSRYKDGRDRYPSLPDIFTQPRYDGSLQDGLMHGSGVITFKQGRKIRGSFDNGFLSGGTVILLNKVEIIIEQCNSNWNHIEGYRTDATLRISPEERYLWDGTTLAFIPSNSKDSNQNSNLTIAGSKTSELRDILIGLKTFEVHFKVSQPFILSDIYDFPETEKPQQSDKQQQNIPSKKQEQRDEL